MQMPPAGILEEQGWRQITSEHLKRHFHLLQFYFQLKTRFFIFHYGVCTQFLFITKFALD